MSAGVLLAIALLPLAAAAPASGQESSHRFSVQAAVGTHLRGGGNSQSLSAGFSPIERLEILVNAERSHWPTEVTRFGATRGGTTTFVSGEVRFVPFSSSRVSLYRLASAGRGISRPNVNHLFPDRVANEAWLLLFGGGGARVTLTRRLSAFADMRFGIQESSTPYACSCPSAPASRGDSEFTKNRQVLDRPRGVAGARRPEAVVIG